MQGTLDEKRKGVISPRTSRTSIGKSGSADLRDDHSTTHKSPPPSPPPAVGMAAGGHGNAVTDQPIAGAGSAEPNVLSPPTQQPLKDATELDAADMDADTPLELEVDGT